MNNLDKLKNDNSSKTELNNLDFLKNPKKQESITDSRFLANLIANMENPHPDKITELIQSLNEFNTNESKIKNDKHSRYKDGSLHKEDKANRAELKNFAKYYVIIYSEFVATVIVTSMFYKIKKIDIISNEVLIALLTTTTINVLAMIIIIIKYFFKSTDTNKPNT